MPESRDDGCLDDAIESSGISPKSLRMLAEALQKVPYLEDVGIWVDEVGACVSGIDASYIVDSRRMPDALYAGMLSLADPILKSRETDFERAARMLFYAIGCGAGYDLKFVKSDPETGVFVASVSLKSAEGQQELNETVCVYIDKSQR